MLKRSFILAICFLLVSAYLGYASRAEPMQVRQPLAGLPLDIGEWHGRQQAAYSDQILAVLRVDDYTTRTYSRAQTPVWFYAGYHGSQRQGASIHSPLNCLPGAGWIPVDQQRLAITVDSAPGGPPRDIEVKRVLIRKGVDTQLVLYWYQSHGRVVASEYWGKVYSVVDAIRWNRTDAALIRVIAPVPAEPNGLAIAERDATDFVRAIFPLLTNHLPS